MAIKYNTMKESILKRLNKKYNLGGMLLPGGMAAPIEGSDAIEFMGQTHDEGGIMMDPQTEVEDGETMDQVTMRDGGNRDYFFSSYLKKGGMSYADMHKNILAMGGKQEDINMLARMQEKSAGRDPNMVAKLGGVVEYNKGGVKAPKGFHWMKKGDGKYKLMEHGDKPFKEHEGASLVADFPIQEKHNPKQDAKMAKRKYQRAGLRIPLETLRQAYPGTNLLSTVYPDPAQEKLDRNFAEGNYLYDDDDITFVDSYGMNFVPDAMQSMPVKPIDTPEMEPKLAQADMRFAPTAFEFIEEQEEDDKDPVNTKEVVRQTNPEAFAKLYPQEAENMANLSKLLNRKVPGEAKLAIGAQFLPAIGAMLTRQEDPEQFEYTSGFTSPIIAGRVRGLKYEAPNQDAARAGLAGALTGNQRFIDTAGLGPASMSNRQALFSKYISGLSQLGAQESKDKLMAENLSKQSQEKANVTNVQNELKTAIANAQLIQKEAMRKQSVDAANTQLRNAKANERVVNRLSILNNLSRGISTAAGDIMSFKASDRIARATGQYGIYERDRVKEALRSLPQYANTSDEELNNIVNNIING